MQLCDGAPFAVHVGVYMTKYSMARSFGGIHPIWVDNLLDAVKTSLNVEADLYVDGRLLVSWMGFEMEHNIEILEKHDITAFVAHGNWCFKWTDETKNVERFFVDFYEYIWQEKPSLQVTIRDHQERRTDIEYPSLESIMDRIDTEFVPKLGSENINILRYSDLGGCESLKLSEIAA